MPAGPPKPLPGQSESRPAQECAQRGGAGSIEKGCPPAIEPPNGSLAGIVDVEAVDQQQCERIGGQEDEDREHQQKEDRPTGDSWPPHSSRKTRDSCYSGHRAASGSTRGMTVGCLSKQFGASLVSCATKQPCSLDRSAVEQAGLFLFGI